MHFWQTISSCRGGRNGNQYEKGCGGDTPVLARSRDTRWGLCPRVPRSSTSRLSFSTAVEMDLPRAVAAGACRHLGRMRCGAVRCGVMGCGVVWCGSPVSAEAAGSERCSRTAPRRAPPGSPASCWLAFQRSALEFKLRSMEFDIQGEIRVISCSPEQISRLKWCLIHCLRTAPCPAGTAGPGSPACPRAAGAFLCMGKEHVPFSSAHLR